MATFTLHRTPASGDLLPARFAQTLGVLAKVPGAKPAPRGAMRSQELRLVHGLSPEDDACARFLLDFPGQGARVSGTTRGPSVPLLAWAFHALAVALKCRLADEDGDVAADPEAHREAALAYLGAYEADVRTSRKEKNDDGESFVRWLAREEHIELVPGAVFDEPLPLEPAELYELLLESEAVADVFLGERELSALLARFRARESLR